MILFALGYIAASVTNLIILTVITRYHTPVARSISQLQNKIEKKEPMQFLSPTSDVDRAQKNILEWNDKRGMPTKLTDIIDNDRL